MFQDETFEYMSYSLANPKNADLRKFDYDSKEHKILESAREFFDLMLNEFGALGWEVVSIQDDAYGDKTEHLGNTVVRILLKRSSKSKHFGTIFDSNVGAIGEIAKQRAENKHLSP